MDGGHRVCIKCHRNKPHSEYYKTGKGTLFSKCKACVLKEQKAWRQAKAKDPEWRRKESQRVLRYYHKKRAEQ
jgi:hypothetical protein